MRDMLEVIEGSVVSSGSQGTGFVPQRRVALLDIPHTPIYIAYVCVAKSRMGNRAGTGQ